MDVLELLEKAKLGDSEAFGGLYDEYADRLFRYILLKIQNRQQAEDLLQETFIKAWRHLDQFEHRGGYFQAWLYKIALNCVNDYYRKIYRSPETLELPDNIDKSTSENIEKQVGDKLETEKLKQAFNLLQGNYKAVLQLRFTEDLSIDETAKILNKSNLAIRVLQHRALYKLQKLIKDNNVLGYSKI